MFDICLLGTGGMMPLPYRWLTALIVRFGGSQLLIDCGEGTQIAMKKRGWSFKPIDTILLTHFHADHVSGLPGLLLTMGNAERTEPLHIYGPRGVEHVVESLRVIAPELPFSIIYHELNDKEEHFQAGPYMVTAFRVNHNVTCYGYSISIPRAGKFDASRAKELGLPVQLWNPLQKGNEVEFDGRVFTSDMVMGPPRRGLKVTYCTDTRPTREIVKAAEGADIFICEGMYGDDEKDAKAVEHKHMTIREAAILAREADPKTMWLTHYSPSLNHPEDYLEEAKKIFSRTTMSRDGRTVVLKFSED